MYEHLAPQLQRWLKMEIVAIVAGVTSIQCGQTWRWVEIIETALEQQEIKVKMHLN